MFPQFALPALVSIVVAFLLSAAEAAIFRMSRVRAQELFDEGRSGAKSLMTVVADSPAYLSVIAFLRVVAEATAAVLVTLAVAGQVESTWSRALISIAIMAVVSFVVVGVSPAHARPAELRHGRPVERALRGRPAARARARRQAARRPRQRRHAGQGLHRRARSRPSPSCATSSTWPATPTSSRPTSAR